MGLTWQSSRLFPPVTKLKLPMLPVRMGTGSSSSPGCAAAHRETSTKARLRKANLAICSRHALFEQGYATAHPTNSHSDLCCDCGAAEGPREYNRGNVLWEKTGAPAFFPPACNKLLAPTSKVLKGRQP